MEIQVNGEKVVVEKSVLTLAELLNLRKVEAPERVSVQLNRKFVNRQFFENTALKEKDEIEFLYFLGGGAQG